MQVRTPYVIATKAKQSPPFHEIAAIKKQIVAIKEQIA